MECALIDSKEKNLKKYYQETKKLKEKAKTKSDWMKEAQQAFNAYVRLRDRNRPCISCGEFHNGQYHAGHYRTTARAGHLRFHPFNNNRQCAPCNNHLSGNIIEYRKGLINKIGIKNVEWLENEESNYKFTIDDLQDIKKYYKEQLKILQQQDSFERWTEGL